MAGRAVRTRHRRRGARAGAAALTGVGRPALPAGPAGGLRDRRRPRLPRRRSGRRKPLGGERAVFARLVEAGFQLGGDRPALGEAAVLRDTGTGAPGARPAASTAPEAGSGIPGVHDVPVISRGWL